MLKKISSFVIYYSKLLFAFTRISFLSQIEYKINFFSGVIVESAYMCIKLTYLLLIRSTNATINSLTPDMIMLFIGIYCLMTGMLSYLNNIMSIPGKVLNGELDMLIVKPCSLRFLLSFSSFDFAMTIPNVTVGLSLIVISWARLKIPVTSTNLSGFVIFILMGFFLTYSFMMIQAVLVFWITSIGGTYTIFTALWDFNSMPMKIYSKTIQTIGTFIIPVFLITNWAGLFVLNRLSIIELLWGLFAPFILFILVQIVWKKSIMRYMGANG